MTPQLPPLLSAYFAAKNKHDIDVMLMPFADDAIVKDEGHEHHGHTAIRAWMEDTTSRYRVTVEIIAVEDRNGKVAVTGRVSGNFLGSPVDLGYIFTISANKIIGLEIA